MIQEQWTEEKPYCIYKHTSPSGKVYIGQTYRKNLNDRWSNGNGYRKCDVFYAAIKKYGWDNFKHEILVQGLTKKEADEAEVAYIAMAKAMGISYNMRDGGSELTESDKERISKSLIGRFVGSKNPFYGCIHPNRGTILMHKGRTHKHIKEEELEQYISMGWKKGQSETTKQAMSEAIKGRIWVKKGNETHNVTPEELEQYLADGWELGRVSNETWCKPCTEDRKKKIAEKNGGGVYVNKSGVCKHIKEEELEQYLADGWKKGQLKPRLEEHRKTMSDRIFMRKDGKLKMVKPEELEQYLADGWIKGRKDPKPEVVKAPSKGRIAINKDGVCKRVSRDVVDGYIAEGWKLGNLRSIMDPSKIKMTRVYVNNGIEQHYVKKEVFLDYIDKGWVKGKLK